MTDENNVELLEMHIKILEEQKEQLKINKDFFEKDNYDLIKNIKETEEIVDKMSKLLQKV